MRAGVGFRLLTVRVGFIWLPWTKYVRISRAIIFDIQLVPNLSTCPKLVHLNAWVGMPTVRIF